MLYELKREGALQTDKGSSQDRSAKIMGIAHGAISRRENDEMSINLGPLQRLQKKITRCRKRLNDDVFRSTPYIRLVRRHARIKNERARLFIFRYSVKPRLQQKRTQIRIWNNDFPGHMPIITVDTEPPSVPLTVPPLQ